MMNKVLNIIDKTSKWTGYGASFLVLGMLAVLMTEVILRYIFQAPTLWAHEMSGFLFGAYFTIAGAYVLLIDGHVSIDLIYGRLSKKQKAILDICTFIFFVLMCITLIWYGGSSAVNAWDTGEKSQSVWGPPLAPVRTMLPIGASLLLLQGLAKLIRNIYTLVVRESS